MSVVDSTAAPTGTGPRRPMVTKKDIWDQVKIDIAGKEVQTAETYSHSWLANQFGHVCLGMLLGSALGVALGSGLSVVLSWLRLPAWRLPFPWDIVAGSVLAVIGAGLWEWWAYRSAVKHATGQFDRGDKLLRDNALVAWAYMTLGVAIAFVYRYFAFTPGEWLGVPNVVWGEICFLVLVIIGIRLAVPWLRQKIVWQKAGLPYLFRLADAQPSMEKDDRAHLQRLINRDPPQEGAPTQIVIGGPIGSGRTQFCAGIGTEFAFRQATVRYLSFATLLEFASRSQNSIFFDDSGPANIAYWPWSEAQVVIIDDIGPLLTAKAPKLDDHVEQFRRVLEDQLVTVREVLARCHTVWVIGDPRQDGEIAEQDAALNGFAREISRFCRREKSEPEVLVAQLDLGATPRAPQVRMRNFRSAD